MTYVPTPYRSNGDTKRADRLWIGDIVSTTGRDEDADTIMSVDTVNTPFGKRVTIRLDNGATSRFEVNKIVKVYYE